MEEELYALLHSSERVFSLAGHQLYWGIAPNTAKLPHLVMTVVSGAEGMTLDGPDGLFQGRVQIDCCGAKRPAAQQLSLAVLDLLQGYAGGGFQGVFLDSSREDVDAAAQGRAARISHDFNVNWSADNG